MSNRQAWAIVGVFLVALVLSACESVGALIAQCDGKWRGFEHQRECSERLAQRLRSEV